jgi:hypothetical protein
MKRIYDGGSARDNLQYPSAPRARINGSRAPRSGTAALVRRGSGELIYLGSVQLSTRRRA